MRTNKCLIVLVLMTVALTLLAGCGTAQPTATMIPAADTPLPTNTSLPPTDTPAPTATMIPATEPPLPTNTPPPPTDAPEQPSEAQTWPTKREAHTMAYDPQSGRVLLFCGYDTWVGALAWEHEDSDLKARDEWTYGAAQNRLELLATTPYVIYNQAVTNGQAGRVIAFGPENTAVYDMESRSWEKMEPPEEPPTYRFWYALAYDGQSDRVILFGGRPHLHDTWAYDYETNTWTDRPSGPMIMTLTPGRPSSQLEALPIAAATRWSTTPAPTGSSSLAAITWGT